MELPLRSFFAASLGLGIIAGLAGCSISTAPAPAQPVIVQSPPAQSGTVVQPGSTVIVPPRY